MCILLKDLFVPSGVTEKKDKTWWFRHKILMRMRGLALALTQHWSLDYLHETNTVNQLQLNYSTNIHLLIPRFMKSSFVITIKLNTLTDVPYQMTVCAAFGYVCENL